MRARVMLRQPTPSVRRGSAGVRWSLFWMWRRDISQPIWLRIDFEFFLEQEVVRYEYLSQINWDDVLID